MNIATRYITVSRLSGCSRIRASTSISRPGHPVGKRDGIAHQRVVEAIGGRGVHKAHLSIPALSSRRPIGRQQWADDTSTACRQADRDISQVGETVGMNIYLALEADAFLSLPEALL